MDQAWIGWCSNEASRTICCAIKGVASRIEIRADNMRFRNLFASLVVALADKDSAKVIGISCRDALSVRVGFRACFFETGVLSVCLAFFDPRGIPLESA
jgi:hypothetical protein